MGKDKNFKPKLKVKKDLSIFSRPKRWPIYVAIAFILLIMIVLIFLFVIPPSPM